jgi:glucosamine-phosphate N-acetyltransferase
MDPPTGYTIRPLEVGDYAKGYLELLGHLTTVGTVTEDAFKTQLERMKSCGVSVFVVTDAEGRVVGSTTVQLEPKIIHGCGFVGHIEDVVVSPDQRGKNLGRLLVQRAVEQAKQWGCYKVILDTAEGAADFYAKLGFRKKELQMRLDL